MGVSMASNLHKAGFEVHGFDVSEKALTRASERGIVPHDSIEEACRKLGEADFVVSSLPRSADVENAMLKDGGVYASSAPGVMVLDTSTIAPSSVHKLA